MKYVLWCVGTFLMAFIILVVAAPLRGHFEREIIIERPIAEVFPHLKSLKEAPQWNAWLRKDPNAKLAYKGVDGELGSMIEWQSSHKELGNADQKIVRIVPNERVDTIIHFRDPMDMKFVSFLSTQALSETRSLVKMGVNNEFTRPMNAVSLIMRQLMSVEEMMTTNTDESLRNLKHLIETPRP